MLYVAQVPTGRESYALELLKKSTGAPLINDCYSPSYKIKKKIKGEWRFCTETLIPGYVFVETANAIKLSQRFRELRTPFRLLGNEREFIPLTINETALMNAFVGNDERMMDMSEGIIEGDEVIIYSGPLVNRAGLIKKIDRHKRIAYLEIEMLGRKLTVKAGLEIVRKHP